MSTDVARASTSPETLTWEDICRRFPNEWVVVIDTDWVNDTDFDFRSATVIARHKQRKDASPDIKAARARDLEVGCFWTGEIRGPIPRCLLP
jgi:hypothetical protein